jgi:hypothetical protein
MSETKKTLRIFGHDVPVTDVPIKTALEQFSEYELEDGSKVKVKFVASQFLRIEGEYAGDGKPVYIVLSAPAVNVISSPDAIMRPPKATKPN